MNDGDTGVLELEVIALRRESDCVLSVELADPEKRALPGWKPGAHIDLGLPEHIRQYSLVGDPSDRHSYRIAVLRERSPPGARATCTRSCDLANSSKSAAPATTFRWPAPTVT